MRKGVIVILAVAIIGAVGLITRHKDSSPPPAPASSQSNGSSVQSANTGSSQTQTAANYKDGSFTGDTESTPYGNVQIAVVVSGGKITDVNFLQMPNDRGHSQEVTSFSEPSLKQETLQAQSAHIDFVSGATSTSEGYVQSLQAALDQAVMA